MQQQEQEDIRNQLQKIERSGALGRSRSYMNLLEFFVDCSAKGRKPKELDIAMEVFGRGADFDPTHDSMVRVYAHNLRQKLEYYYATEGAAEPCKLTLPRGEYRIALTRLQAPVEREVETPSPLPAEPPPPATRAPRLTHRGWLAAGAALIFAVGAVVGLGVSAWHEPAKTPAQIAAASPLWAAVLADNMPVTLVLGDYYIFGELDPKGGVDRLVRDFSVNSSQDLDELIMYNPSLLGKYKDLDLTYLPRGSAFALLDVLRVMNAAKKPIRIVTMADFSTADLKNSHVVYVGYISALGRLENFVFSSSALAVGGTYDELRDVASGHFYTSDEGAAERHNYRDYGLISTFPGPAGNQFLIIAGMRDAGMMQVAHVLGDPAGVRSVEAERPDAHGPQPPSFEMLYEVMGFSGTNLDAALVHKATLSYSEIWGGTLLRADARN
jgi:hypothetical protein